MSHDINHIMNAISEANRALQAEPDYKHRIFALETESESRRQRIAELEITISKLRDQISDLNTNVRALEVARDEAQFHQLEAQDKADQAVAVLNQIVKNAQDYIVAVTPPPPVEPATSAPEQHTELAPVEELKPEPEAPQDMVLVSAPPTDKGESEMEPTPEPSTPDTTQTPIPYWLR